MVNGKRLQPGHWHELSPADGEKVCAAALPPQKRTALGTGFDARVAGAHQTALYHRMPGWDLTGPRLLLSVQQLLDILQLLVQHAADLGIA